MQSEIKRLIAVIGTVGVPASYGGFETLVENIIESNNVNYVVYCSSQKYPKRLKKYKSAKLVYIPLNANGVTSIIYDVVSIMHAVYIERANNLLILGVSGCFILPLIRKFTSVKICTNIDGLEWKRDKWSTKAKRFLKWSEKVAVKYSHSIIADNQEIANYVKREYGKDSSIIAYGGDHAVATHKPVDNIYSEIEGYALALCRIEPENNVHIILEAFKGSGKNLKFIGNWDNSDYGKRLKKDYSRFHNIQLLDPIYDIEKLDTIRRRCSLYIHGHSAGGTNPSLVEMMFFGKTIICFDCEYNRFTTYGCSYYFSTCLDLRSKISSLHDDKQGSILKLIAEKNYTWDKIKSQYESLF